MHEKLEKVRQLIIKLIYSIGFFGEPITFIYACIMLYMSYTYLFTYFVTYILFKIIVENIKNIIRNPRPNHPKKLFANDNYNSNKIHVEDINYSFGMPSGHASGVSFTLAFVYLLTYK